MIISTEDGEVGNTGKAQDPKWHGWRADLVP